MKQSIWVNKSNIYKFIILREYKCGHYYWQQFLTTAGGIQYIGTVGNKRRLSRVSCSTWKPVLLEDYVKVTETEATRMSNLNGGKRSCKYYNTCRNMENCRYCASYTKKTKAEVESNGRNKTENA